MHRPLFRIPILASVLLISCLRLSAAPAMITVDVDKPGQKISPDLYGIFFEDINCSADGGLYAELVRNRNFQDSERPDHWSLISSGEAKASMIIATANPVGPKNPRYLKLTVEQTGVGRVGIANGGFWGMAVKKGESYDFSLLARAESEAGATLQISLESGDSLPYAKGVIKNRGQGLETLPTLLEGDRH